MRVPGIVYGLLTAAGVFLVEYFTTGDGSLLLWGPIALAVVQVAMKWFTVNTPEQPVPQSDFGGPGPQQRSKVDKFLWG